MRLERWLQVINDDLITVKQLADKLGTTKNRVAYQARKVADDNISLIDGVQHLNKQAQQQVIDAIKQLDIDDSADSKQGSTAEQSADNDAIKLLQQRIEGLEALRETLEAQLRQRDAQLDAKDVQINQLHTIIATQAQQQGRMIEHDANAELMETQTKKSWWQRLFSQD